MNEVLDKNTDSDTDITTEVSQLAPNLENKVKDCFEEILTTTNEAELLKEPSTSVEKPDVCVKVNTESVSDKTVDDLFEEKL